MFREIFLEFQASLMHMETVPNRNSLPAIHLREGYREGGKVVKGTLWLSV